jgi:hypothetical protein
MAQRKQMQGESIGERPHHFQPTVIPSAHQSTAKILSMDVISPAIQPIQYCTCPNGEYEPFVPSTARKDWSGPTLTQIIPTVSTHSTVDAADRSVESISAEIDGPQVIFNPPTDKFERPSPEEVAAETLALMCSGDALSVRTAAAAAGVARTLPAKRKRVKSSPAQPNVRAKRATKSRRLDDFHAPLLSESGSPMSSESFVSYFIRQFIPHWATMKKRWSDILELELEKQAGLRTMEMKRKINAQIKQMKLAAGLLFLLT